MLSPENFFIMLISLEFIDRVETDVSRNLKLC